MSDINNHVSQTKKRLEENYKLVFKKALKYLLNNYKYMHNIKDRKNTQEQKFYDHYFRDVFQKEGLTNQFFLSGTSPKPKEG